MEREKGLGIRRVVPRRWATFQQLWIINKASIQPLGRSSGEIIHKWNTINKFRKNLLDEDPLKINPPIIKDYTTPKYVVN